MLSHSTQASGHIAVTGRNHASLPRGQDLPGMKAETCHQRIRTTNSATLILRTNRTCSVFDDNQTMAGRYLSDFAQSARQPDLMDDEDCLGAVGDRTLGPIGIQIEGERINIHENRPCPCVYDRIGGSNERQAGAEHFVARTNPRGHKCEVQRGCAGGNGNGFGSTYVLSKAPLELAHSRSLADPAAPENFEKSLLFTCSERRPRHRNGFRCDDAHRASTAAGSALALSRQRMSSCKPSARET